MSRRRGDDIARKADYSHFAVGIQSVIYAQWDEVMAMLEFVDRRANYKQEWEELMLETGIYPSIHHPTHPAHFITGKAGKNMLGNSRITLQN